MNDRHDDGMPKSGHEIPMPECKPPAEMNDQDKIATLEQEIEELRATLRDMEDWSAEQVAEHFGQQTPIDIERHTHRTERQRWEERWADKRVICAYCNRIFGSLEDIPHHIAGCENHPANKMARALETQEKVCDGLRGMVDNIRTCVESAERKVVLKEVAVRVMRRQRDTLREKLARFDRAVGGYVRLASLAENGGDEITVVLDETQGIRLLQTRVNILPHEAEGTDHG